MFRGSLGSGFTYQGQLLDGGTLAQGIYEISATLHDAPSGGSVVAGPVLVSNVQVVAGLFTTVIDFGTPAYGTEARWLQLAFRRVGEAAFVPLAPRQELTPTPFAIRSESALLATQAQSAPWSGLTGVPGGFADGIDNDLLASFSCSEGEVAGRIAGAWTCLVPGTVRQVDSGPGLSGGPISSTGTLRVANAGIQSEMLAVGAVTSAAIGDGAVGANDVNASEVQRRVLGNCAVGKAIVGIASDGTVTCADVVVPVRPNRLGPPEVPVAATGSRFTTTTAGRPAIFFGLPSSTGGVVCPDSACQGTPATTGSLLGAASSLAVARTGSDRPLVVAAISGLNAVATARCSDASCTSFGAWQSVYNGSATIGKNGIDARPGIPPVVAFSTGFGFGIARCNSDDCTLTTGISGGGGGGETPAVAVGSTGISVIAAKLDNDELRVYECTSPDCTSLAPGGIVSVWPDNIGPGFGITLAGPSDVYVALGTLTGRLFVAHCTSMSCASHTLTTIVTSSALSRTLDLAIGANGFPILSFVRTVGDYDLVVVSCQDANCSRTIRTILETGADSYLQDTEIVVPADGLPVIMVNGDSPSNPPIVLKCSTPTCQ